MRTLWHGIVRIVFWSYDRGTWPYDLMVLAIVLIVFLSPRGWFHDQPQIGPPPHTVQVEPLGEDPASGWVTYRVDARLLAPPKRTPELQGEIHEVLGKNVDNLGRHNFQVMRIEPVRGENGAVVSYEVKVSVRK